MAAAAGQHGYEVRLVEPPLAPQLQLALVELKWADWQVAANCWGARSEGSFPLSDDLITLSYYCMEGCAVESKRAYIKIRQRKSALCGAPS
jgi:hypothetical protein